jgi:hypothetical protein
MRCPQCGFISFDHLDGCPKCRTDLIGERRRLNLPDTEPNPISLLEIMKRMPVIAGRESGAVKSKPAPKTALPEIEGPEIELDQGPSLKKGLPFDPEITPPQVKNFQPPEGGIDLSLEGLEDLFPPGKEK